MKAPRPNHWTARELPSGLPYLAPESNESDLVFHVEHHAGFGLIFKTEQYQNSLKQYLFVY